MTIIATVNEDRFSLLSRYFHALLQIINLIVTGHDVEEQNLCELALLSPC